MKALEDPPVNEYVIEQEENEKKVVTPTAFEAAMRKAMDTNGDSELADMLSEFES